MDVNNAFLYGDLTEDVYMIPPPGFFVKNEKRVCKLVKSLYGLKRAPRQWNKKLVETLPEASFLQSKDDHSLFVKNKDGKFLALLVYVDDIIITGNNNDEISKFKIFLNQKFKIKDLGELKVWSLACKPCKPVATPMPENGILPHKETENDKLLKNITSYQKIVGNLIYLCNTRPDIAYSVHCIIYTKSNISSISTYADSDWAKCKMTRRSMASTVCEVMWIVKILKDLNFSSNIPALLFCDNSSAIQIAANPVMHEKTKHFDIDVHLIREKVASGLIKPVKVDSEKQIADILTKGLGRTIVGFSGFLSFDIN
ncbi:ribonuclease H-like domain-containing protein [Tanacetum coccineum]